MMGRCPVGGGKCEKECAVLEVEDELECSCGCSKHDHDQCQEKRSSHSWNRESCECECRDQSLQRQCLESPGKLWDSSSCSCICQHQDSCEKGLIFNSKSCLCEPTDTFLEDIEKSEIVKEDRDIIIIAEESDAIAYLVTHWIEIVIIIVLATASVILIIVIVLLIRRVEKMKEIINKTTDAASDQTDVHSSRTSPDLEERQIKHPGQKADQSTAKGNGHSPTINNFNPIKTLFNTFFICFRIFHGKCSCALNMELLW